MKEQGMYFTEEQKELLKEIDKIESAHANSDFKFSNGMPERVFVDERKTLSTERRMSIANEIIAKYSMLKKPKGILHEQLFSAMEEYLKTITETGYRCLGL